MRISTTVLIVENNTFITNFDTAISLFIFIGYLLTTSHIHERQLSWTYEQQIEQKEQENHNLNQLVTKLGTLYDEIRGFRHDFAGIISSLAPAIDHQDMSTVDKLFHEAFLPMNQKLSKADYTAFNLKNIEDIAFRNVLAQKMIQAQAEQIEFHLEARQLIPKVDTPMLEVIRLLSILLDNAIEGASATDHPVITVALTHEGSTVTFTVQNTRQPGPIDARKIWEKGYSTKGEQRGIGLAMVLEIIHQFDNVEIETRIDTDTFTQSLIFEERGAS
ncbi:MAG: GHKL domain-containing protein [Aerococcus sp.]|nr:GHKL domain-containing protein [Aerococcus sp.]